MRRRHRPLVAIAALAGLVVLCAQPVAVAGDVLANVGPASQVPGRSLMDAYPLGNYALDHHFSAVDAGVFSGVDVSGIAPTIAWFLASVIWLVTSFLAYATITLFSFAFSLDLVNGSGATGGAGALAPVSEAVRSIYRTAFGGPWLVLAITVAGLWALWHALVRRRYTETAGALGLSLVFVVIALAFVTQPQRTIGEASRWTNEMSGAFLSLSAEGDITSRQQAKRAAADQLFGLLVFEPWVVTQFGGREHCVRANSGDDPESVPVRPLSRDPARDTALSRRLTRSSQISADGKTCVNAANKYAPKFLRYPSGSDARDRHHQALKDGDTGKAPDQDQDGYRLGPADKPAADAMGQDGQYQRLLMAIVVLGGETGAFLLIGALSVAVILAQILMLVLLAFAPVALVMGVLPGRGHDFFRAWLQRLAAFLVRKAAYSLILAVLLAVAAALAQASSNLGWLMSWGLQGAFFWAVFIWRRQLLGQITKATTGHTTDTGGAGRLLSAAALAHATSRLWQRHRPRRDHHAPSADAPPRSRPAGQAAAAPSDADTRPPPAAQGTAPDPPAPTTTTNNAPGAGDTPPPPSPSRHQGDTRPDGPREAGGPTPPPDSGHQTRGRQDPSPSPNREDRGPDPDSEGPLQRGLRDDADRLHGNRPTPGRPADEDPEQAQPPTPGPLADDQPDERPDRPQHPASPTPPTADTPPPTAPRPRRDDERGERR